MTDGFQKIEINSNLPKNDKNQEAKFRSIKISSSSSTGGSKKRVRTIKFFGILIAILAILGIFGFFAIFLPLKKSFTSATEAYKSAKDIYSLIKNQDIVNAGEKLKETKEKLLITQKNIKVLSWAKIIPVAGKYYQDAEHLLNAGIYGVEAAQTVIEAIKPHADLLGLKGQGSFVLGSAEERIQKAVQTMDKITPKIGEVEEKINLIQKEVGQIDPNRYPEEIFGKKIHWQLITLKDLINQGSLAISDAKPVLETLPKLLGEPTPKKYLIIFQNDKELRSTGGFITAYAIFRIEHGKIYVETSDDIYKLDESRALRVSAPEPILKYLPLVPYWNLRDSNISPDFKVSIENFEKLYASSTNKEKIDGIIAVDTHVLLKTMEVLGPIELYGTKFTTNIDVRCNCPNVIYELEDYASKPVGYIRESRKDLIGALMYAIMQKALSSSPKLYWGRLFQVGIDELNQKHILIYLHDEKAQEGLEALNFAGRLREFNGDYLHINDTNFAGAKSNMYVRHEVDQKIEKQSDGSIIKTITLKYKNPQPPSNCDLEKGELCLNGLLRNWLRVYVPKGSQLIEAKGSEVKVNTYEDLSKTVFEGFLVVRPQGSAQVVIKYKLPFVISEGQDLNLLIQKQPGTEGHKYTIQGGSKVEEFNLTTDKELKIKL